MLALMKAWPCGAGQWKRCHRLAIYIAIGVTGAAFGQPKEPPTYYPIPPSMQKAFATSDPLLDQLAAQTAGNLPPLGPEPDHAVQSQPAAPAGGDQLRQGRANGPPPGSNTPTTG